MPHAADVPPEIDEVFLAMMMRVRELWKERAERLELTPPMAGTLMMLEEPQPMRALAEMHGCDASNMTGIADRLEARGLAERRPDPDDRRVKLLALTPSGRRARAVMQGSGLMRELPEMQRLTETERRQLASLLWKVFGPA